MEESGKMSMNGGADEMQEDGIFDEIMEQVGTHGKFQKQFNFLFNFLLVVVAGMSYLNLIIAMSVPEHWCHVPGREKTNFSHEEWKKLTLPSEIDTRGRETHSKCSMYNLTINDELLNLISTDSFETSDYDIIDCQYGWEYDNTWYEETAPSEQDWVCHNELFVTNTFVFGRIGDVIGTFIFGQLGDAIGRRPVFYITLVIVTCGRLLSAFSAHNHNLFLAAALIGSLTSTAVFMAPMIIAMEISRNTDRAKIQMVQCFGWVLGMCMMPLIMWAMRHWFIYMIVTTLPGLFFLFSCKFMIESPRWLAGRGKTKACLAQLKHIARVNGTTVPPETLSRLGKRTDKPESVYGIMSLMSSWRLMKNTLLLIFTWSTAQLVYYTLMFNINNMAGNPFLNYLWQALAEIPGYMVGMRMCNRFGRRMTLILAFSLTTIACIPTIFVIDDPSKHWITTASSAFIKFSVSLAFFVSALISLETYPTCLRQTGTAACAVSANALGVLGPYIVYLGTTFDARYPYILVTFLSVIAAISGSFLPETLNQKLPETLAEAHEFGKHQKYWSLPRRITHEKDNIDLDNRSSILNVNKV